MLLIQGDFSIPFFYIHSKKNLCFLYAFVGSIAQALFFEPQSLVLLSSLLAILGIFDLNLQITKEFQRTFEPYIQ